MDKEKWKDEEIESLLREMPKIADGRTKEVVLNRLKADDRLGKTERKMQKAFKWIPVAVAIAAVFLIIVLWPPLQGNEFKQEIVSESAADDARLINEEADLFSDDALSTSGISHVVLKETLGDDDVYVPMDLVSQGYIIPVTFILSAQQVAAEFPDTEVTADLLYKRYVEEVDVRSLAFDAIVEESGEVGTVSFFKYLGATRQSYLIPNERANLTAKEALLNMAIRPDEKLESVIPDSIHYEVTIHGEIAWIHFEELLDLSELEQDDAMMLLEGFMLTAEQFNLAVQFENISPLYWGTYDLTKSLPKPIAINPLYDLYK